MKPPDYRFGYDGPEYFLVDKWVYEEFRRAVCKRVYRSRGKGRKKRLKWLLRSFMFMGNGLTVRLTTRIGTNAIMLFPTCASVRQPKTI
jgi:hypothetical protein